jgi:putative ABC transport system ATP-binding protein
MLPAFPSGRMACKRPVSAQLAHLSRCLSKTDYKAFSSSRALLRHPPKVPTSQNIRRGGLYPSVFHKDAPQSVPRTSIHPDAVTSARALSTTPTPGSGKPTVSDKSTQTTSKTIAEDEDDPDVSLGFEKTEKASQASQVNLSARLSKDGKPQGNKPAAGEIWRLLKIAKPEAKELSMAFLLLLTSSAVTMSIPFSIGKILDIATKSQDGVDMLFGLPLPVFYSALAGVLAIGAAANYGRIIILRIVGERIVARLRSRLFRQTYIQNAEFFDANRVGDLISRLSSDTIIVGKSCTQNMSDGLRAGVSGGAGFSLMTYTSPKLTAILALLFPPVAVGAFFYGRAIRNLSRKIQKNLGTLTKIAEERLGNVRTSQAFAGEILEVHRYNKQVRKLFELGKKESLISATFFSTVSHYLLHVCWLLRQHPP